MIETRNTTATQFSANTFSTICGKIPARIIMIAPDAIAKRLTTLVIATSPDPIFHNGKSWISVPIPAMIIALWAEESPLAPATIRIGQNTIVFCNCNNFKQILPCSAIQIWGGVHYNEIRTKKDKYKGGFICNMDILIMKKESISLTA